MARKKRVRKHSHRRSAKFSWSRFWNDFGLKDVYKVLHGWKKKWPKSREFNTFFGFLCMVVFGIFILPRHGLFHYSGGHHQAAPSSEVATTATDGVADTTSWSEWVQRLYSEGKWTDTTFRLFGNRPSVSDTAALTPKKLNCTTYVETVGALARSADFGDFYDSLIAIRYNNGRTTYADRNHFPEADWIPNNERAGILKDITHEVASGAGLMARIEEKVIDKSAWVTKQAKPGGVSRTVASEASEAWAAPTKVQVPYIPLEQVDKVLPQIPNGAIVNLVRANNSGHDVLIGHQGFFVREKGRPMFRHANTQGKVQTVPLRFYFGLQQKKHWPLIGINVNVFTPGRGVSFQPPR